MKPVTKIICIIILLAIKVQTVSHKSYAQKPVIGNGDITEQIRPLSQFKSITLDFTADVVVVNGETPSFHIEGEENILPNIGTKIRGGTLYISQDRWIEPTHSVKIRVGTPFISELTTSGYSNVAVENLNGPRLRLNIGVGTVTLHGTSDRIQIRTKTGKIDAAQLKTKYVDVAISSHGEVMLGKIDELVANVAKRGKVIYAGDPDIKVNNDETKDAIVHVEDYKKPEEEDAVYVSLTIVNNSRQRVNLKVEGPQNRNFSYGFSMNPTTKRREDWPVGTRLYTESGLLSDKLLLVVTEEMTSKQVDIFTKE